MVVKRERYTCPKQLQLHTLTCPYPSVLYLGCRAIIFLDTEIPQLATNTGKSLVLGTSSTARLLPGSVPQQLSCLSMMQSLSLLNPAKAKLAVHSTR